jgi:hypothetical protein
MHKVWICLTALAICLSTLPVPAGAGDRMHRYWRHHQSYFWHRYYRPYYSSFPYYGYFPYRYRNDCYRAHPGVIFGFDFD